jgi:hypothetical protein
MITCGYKLGVEIWSLLGGGVVDIRVGFQGHALLIQRCVSVQLISTSAPEPNWFKWDFIFDTCNALNVHLCSCAL